MQFEVLDPLYFPRTQLTKHELLRRKT